MAKWYSERNWALIDMLTLCPSRTVAMSDRIDAPIKWSHSGHA